MKGMRDYLKESERVHEYRLKVSRKPTDDEMDRIERYLSLRHEVIDVGTPKRMELGKNRRDFRSLGEGIDPHFVDFKTKYPLSPTFALGQLSQQSGIGERHLHLLSKDDPLFAADEDGGGPDRADKPKSLLADPGYSEAGKVRADALMGEKFKKKFIDAALKGGAGTGFEVDAK